MISAPAIIVTGLLLVAFGWASAKHGEPREPYDAGKALVSVCVWIGLLYWGDFYG